MDPATRDRRPKIALLAYRDSFARVEPALARWRGHLEPVLVGKDGALGNPGAEALRDSVIAWASPEVFIDGVLPQFAQHVLACGKLQWFQSGSAGYDNPWLRSIIARGGRFTVNSAPSTCIAEYVFAAVLDHLQNGAQRRADRLAKAWRPASCREIAGSTWLILGFGAIGSRVAHRARAFEARVIAVNRSGGADPAVDELYTLDALPSLIPRADVIVVAMPLTEQTKELAGEAFFGRMKQEALFVNVSRGGLVEESALLRGLDRGVPSHAILDVFASEPLPADSPFWGHPRVSMTPHLAGMGSGLVRRSDEIFIENLRRFMSGEPLRGELAGAP
jgi:glyoxylate/hydroxypyruvate reductase